jgi:heat shock protein HslJ
MKSIKRRIFLATSIAMLGLLAACGVPGSGSTSANAPTVEAEATAVAATTMPATPTMEPETATADGPTAAETATADGLTANELDDTSWQLAEFGPADAIQTASGEVTLIFSPGNIIGGVGGCNSYGGSYTFDGTAFSVSNVASTEMACADNSLMQLESAFTAALNSATGLAMNGDELRITYPEGTLRFTRLEAPAVVPVEGTVWQLESFVSGTGDNGSASSLVNGSSITAKLSNGTIAGSAGCNQFTAPYTLEGETLTVGDIVTTRMACDGPVMQQEQAFVDALGAATSLTIDGTSLVLTHPDGQLIFRAEG